LPSVASVNCWKFEPQMTGAYWRNF
jgi:hypothetical protein